MIGMIAPRENAPLVGPNAFRLSGKAPYRLQVGKVNTAPSRIPVGQRLVTVLSRV